MSQTLLVLSTILGPAIATPILQSRAVPTVTLDNATVTGFSSGNVSQYLGIPYAQPPTGDLRFQLPQQLPPYNTSLSATEFGPACPQQALNLSFPSNLPANTTDTLNLLSQYYTVSPASEDCLTLNVITPADATPSSSLPVVVWFYGGNFQVGGTSSVNGSVIVERAISLGVPAVYVSMNYRLNVFGFLASQEIGAAGVGNLGLQDQRLALRWVQKYISAFGGDPTKVTIWGEGAGAVSVSLQMVTNSGNPDGLFRAAFMGSGFPLPAGSITQGQPYYDMLVQATGCSNTTDTLQCLRGVPFNTLMGLVDQSTSSAFSQWLPLVDGDFLTDDPQYLVLQGTVADVPFITGDTDDEGTLMSFSTLDITSDSQFQDYIQTYWLPDATHPEIEQVLSFYPSDVTQGSPFDTGDLNALTPQFKRIAAFIGDAIFQGPRRFILQLLAGRQDMWTYISKRDKTLPYIGSYHVSDVLSAYNGSDLTSYLVRFVANLDPNVGQSSDIFWPQYTNDYSNMLELSDGPDKQVLTNDTFREDAIECLSTLLL